MNETNIFTLFYFDSWKEEGSSFERGEFEQFGSIGRILIRINTLMKTDRNLARRVVIFIKPEV